MNDKIEVPYQLETETWKEYLFRLRKLGFYVNWNPETTNNFKKQQASDLSTATAATIDEIRKVYQLQFKKEQKS